MEQRKSFDCFHGNMHWQVIILNILFLDYKSLTESKTLIDVALLLFIVCFGVIIWGLGKVCGHSEIDPSWWATGTLSFDSLFDTDILIKKL